MQQYIFEEWLFSEYINFSIKLIAANIFLYKRQQSKIDYHLIIIKYVNYQMNKLTICIPRVENNVNKKLIYDVFNDYDFGTIKKIDLINIGKYLRRFHTFNVIL